MKYKHIPWKQLSKEYKETIFVCKVSYFIALLTWVSKAFNPHNMWNAFLCGIYVSWVINIYIRERFYSIDKWQKIISEMCNKEAQRVITLIDAEIAKRDVEEGEEWKH